MQYIFQSVESADLDASSGVIHMLESSGKKLSASSSALSDIVQCEQLKRERSLGLWQNNATLSSAALTGN